MSKDPALLLYTADCLTHMADLTLEERGQYITMACLQHQKGPLSPKLLLLQLGKKPSQDVLQKFTVNNNGDCFLEWVEVERNRRKSHSNKQRQNVMKRWNKETKPIPNKYDGITTVIPLETDTVTVTDTVTKTKTEIYPGFEDFWTLYDKKKGSKKIIQAKWNRQPYKIKLKIMEYLPAYIESTPDKIYRKNPETFFNQEGWKDEIIHKTNNNGRKKNNLYANLKQQNALKVDPSELYNEH